MRKLRVTCVSAGIPHGNRRDVVVNGHYKTVEYLLHLYYYNNKTVYIQQSAYTHAYTHAHKDAFNTTRFKTTKRTDGRNR